MDSPQPVKPPRPREWIVERLRRECDASLRRVAERRALGESRAYQSWITYEMCGLALAHRYFFPGDASLLDAMRAEADYALTLQRPDGTFAGYHMTQYGRTPKPWSGGTYDCGPAGELWVLAAALSGDAKYREASRRLVHAYKDYRIEFNYNFAAFALYHLSAHYKLTGEADALENAVYYAKHLVAIDLTPMGFHAGHNYYSCYGSITLRGIALLACVLPEGDPYRAVLREQVIRMANQAITRLQPDGMCDGRNRYFIGSRWWMWGLFPVAFLLGPEDAARLDAVIQRMLHAPEGEPEMIAQFHLLQPDVVRYFALRERVLAGENMDALALS